ncbi:MAG TPA: hypothetical protein VK973_03160 [Arenicellales bacterium]|nr:hypothetical protein [Arenicellales bacterium]
MQSSRILARALAALTLTAVSAAAAAGSFNCAVVYDEFESLMNKRFLTQPDQFVATQPGQISKEQFEGVANAGFLLYPAREGMGIGILTTNQNIHAKFLFHWSQPMEDGSTHLILDEVVKYGRVSDGYAPSRVGPFRLKPGMSIDLDSGNYVPMESSLIDGQEFARKQETGDLLYESGPDGAVLRAVNGAEVQFPLETLCQQGSA